MIVNVRTIRENWMILSAFALLIMGAAKLKWQVDTLNAEAGKFELRLKSLEDANLIRQGAAEVWRARGLIGPPPAPARTP